MGMSLLLLLLLLVQIVLCTVVLVLCDITSNITFDFDFFSTKDALLAVFGAGFVVVLFCFVCSFVVVAVVLPFLFFKCCDIVSTFYECGFVCVCVFPINRHYIIALYVSLNLY